MFKALSHIKTAGARAVTYLRARRAKGLAILALCMGLAACGLPRSGPTKGELLSSNPDVAGQAHIVPVTQSVTQVTRLDPTLGFTSQFLNAGLVDADTISPGDTLGLTLWENVNDGILTTAGTPAALEEVQVDSAGMIFVPYAGRIRAAGHTPDALRRIITSKLDEQTPDPQVLVRRLAGNGATVSVTGSISGQGIYPIERPSRYLSGMIAAAGGVSIEPEIALITIIRGAQRGRIWLSDLNERPELDIALRNGDRIIVEADTRAYTALGATGGQSRVQFETQTVSALEALAQVGGLRTALADPKGIFVLRDESSDIANAVLGRHDLTGPQRIIYVMNLTEPEGLFDARDFEIRDEDTIYVTEAPFVQWNKAVSALIGSLGSLQSASSFDLGS